MNDRGLRKQTLRKELALFDERYESLGYDLSRQADPSVERLLEGFCYLTQELQAFVDASSPDVALHLLNLLWPTVLQDLPAMSIAKVNPANHPVFLPKDTVFSAIMEDNQLIRFSSMLDHTILPLAIESASIEGHCITVNFVSQGTCDLKQLEKIWVYVDPQAQAAYNLFYVLTQSLKSMRLKVGGSYSVLPEACFPMALQGHIEDPFILINYFFQCPNQFLFFEMGSLHHYLSPGAKAFSLVFECRQALRWDPSMSTLCHLNCVPLINTFSQACEPLSITADRDTYSLCADDREEGLRIINITEMSARTLAGEVIPVFNPYLHKHALPGLSCVSHKLKNSIQLVIDVNQVKQPLVLSAQARVYQSERSQGLYWKTAKLSTELGHLKGRLLEKLSLPVENLAGDPVSLLAVLQSGLRLKTSLSELQFLLTTLLCRHFPKALRMIAGIVAFSGRAVFRVHLGLVTEVVVWDIQLHREHFENLAALYQFAGMLESLINLYRPPNKQYHINIIEYPDEAS